MLCIPLVIFALIIIADDDDGVSERSSSQISSLNLCKQRKNRGQKCIYNFLLHFVQHCLGRYPFWTTKAAFQMDHFNEASVIQSL